MKGSIQTPKPYLERLRDMPLKNLRYYVMELKKPVPGFEYEGLHAIDALTFCTWILKKRERENETPHSLQNSL
jgi:hypothetical protein